MAIAHITVQRNARKTALRELAAAQWLDYILVKAGRCLAKRSLVPNNLYGVLHASEWSQLEVKKWRGAQVFYKRAYDAAFAREGGCGGVTTSVFRENRMVAGAALALGGRCVCV